MRLSPLEADQKWQDYRMHCDRLFFATAPHVPAAIFPDDAGLILADGFGAALVRQAPEHRLHPATRRSMLLAFARAAALRLQALVDPTGRYEAQILRTSSMSRLKKVAFWLVAGILICAPIVLAELYLRSVGLGNPILFYANASYRFAPQPNQQRLRRRGATVTIDSKGLRSTTDWTAPADAKLLFIGDSVTWGGTYVDDRDTFAEGVCRHLAEQTGKRYGCGNAGVNQYGTENMAERIRYKNVDDESILVVTMIAHDTVRGLVDAEGRYFFMQQPPPPFRALWEATTFLTWTVYKALRQQTYRPDDDLRVAERSLENLFAAIRETQRPGRNVLIVLSPIKDELHGREGPLTKHVRSVLARSGFDWLDLHTLVSAVTAPDFYYDQMHLDVPGHTFYADQIASRLMAMNNDAPRERATTRSGNNE